MYYFLAIEVDFPQIFPGKQNIYHRICKYVPQGSDTSELNVNYYIVGLLGSVWVPISHTTFNVHDLCRYPLTHHHSHYTPPSLLFWFFNKLLNNRYLLWYVWKIVIDMQINLITMNKYLYLLNASRLDGFRGNLYWFSLFFRSYLLELPVTIRWYLHTY